MYFAASLYTYLLVLVPIVLALYVYAFVRKRQALRAFMDPSLISRLLPGRSRRRQWAKALCMVGAVGALVVALMQPQWGIDWQDIPRHGRDLIILLDVSISMKAQDVSPSRLEQAKEAVKKLVEYLQKTGGHRLGLVAFAGRASLQSPMTLDYPFFIKRLEQVGPETVTRDGTSIGSAIRQVLEGFSKIEHEYTDIIILTDGEDHNSFPLEAARLAAAKKMNLYTVGIGDASRGHLVPIKWTEEGLPFFAKYKGQAVHVADESESAAGNGAADGRRLPPRRDQRGASGAALPRMRSPTSRGAISRSPSVNISSTAITGLCWLPMLLLAADMLLRERKIPVEGQA